MPNRTIYLPDEIDALSRRLGLNLSRLTQQAIAAVAETRSADAIEARVDAASERIVALGIEWPERALDQMRQDAGER